MLPSSVDPLVSLMMVEKVPDSTYDMIGGLDQQIKEIKEVIELGLKHPELFESLGIAQPKGVLLYGPPGTGKTLLARAVAHHTDCKFIRVSGSELVQKYIGEGSRMVRELFVMAREHAPSIIFMDEIDSIGSSRVEGSSGGDSEVQRTMLELLNQLDGFEPTKNIKIIMATNRLDILDPALLRPGRIDRKIEFPPPSVEARADILRIHSRKMNLTRGINLTKIAEKMNGCSGAELKGVCTEAGMYALRERRVHVTQEDFELATAKILNKHDDKEGKSIAKQHGSALATLEFFVLYLWCCKSVADNASFHQQCRSASSGNREGARSGCVLSSILSPASLLAYWVSPLSLLLETEARNYSWPTRLGGEKGLETMPPHTLPRAHAQCSIPSGTSHTWGVMASVITRHAAGIDSGCYWLKRYSECSDNAWLSTGLTARCPGDPSSFQSVLLLERPSSGLRPGKIDHTSALFTRLLAQPSATSDHKRGLGPHQMANDDCCSRRRPHKDQSYWWSHWWSHV